MKISDLIVLNALHTFNTCGEVLYRDKMKTALSAVLPKLMVTVKELEWMKSPLSSDIWLCVSYEEYKITRWWLDNSQDEIGHYGVDALDGEQFGTIEEAQLAAQAHFERASLERMELVQSDVVSWPVAAQDMLSTWDRWLGTQNSTEDDRVQADILLKAACFAAQAYEDTIGGMSADKAPVDLMKAFLIAIIDMNDPRLDQYRAGNRKNRPEPDTLTAETVIKKIRVDYTHGIPVRNNGKEYKSISSFARENGLNGSSLIKRFSYAIRRDRTSIETEVGLLELVGIEAVRAAAQADYEHSMLQGLELVKDGTLTNEGTKPVDVAAVRRQALEEAEHVVGSTVLKHIASDYDGMTSLEAYEAGQMNGMTCALDAIRALSAEPAQGEQLKRIGFIDHFSMMAIKHGADFSEITISKAAIDTHIYPIYAAPTTEAGR